MDTVMLEYKVDKLSEEIAAIKNILIDMGVSNGLFERKSAIGKKPFEACAVTHLDELGDRIPCPGYHLRKKED